MSRYSDYDYDGEDYPGQWALWEANARRALKGKQGRKVLSDLRDALRALPEKRLIDSAVCSVDAEKRAESMVQTYRVLDEEITETWERDKFLSDVARQGEGVCAVGAYLWWRKVKAGTDPVEAFNQLPTVTGYDSNGLTDTATLAKQEAGVVFSLAWQLAYRNDETYANATPEERYARFLEWIDAELTGVAA